MPKENVERAIKRATSKEQENYKEMVYEGYAPHGIAVLIETTTDNPTRTVANVRSYFNKLGGSLGTSGSVDFMFERKCYFRIPASAVANVEEFEFEMIDFGAEEVFIEEEDAVIYANFTDFGSIQKALEEKHIEIKSSGFERIPMDTKELTPEQQEEVNKLIERIEEDDDVQFVFTNMR